MKAYVITLKESNRLQNGKIAGYPSSLPEPEVFYGVERNEPITIPQFSVYKKCRQGGLDFILGANRKLLAAMPETAQVCVWRLPPGNDKATHLV